FSADIGLCHYIVEIAYYREQFVYQAVLAGGKEYGFGIYPRRIKRSNQREIYIGHAACTLFENLFYTVFAVYTPEIIPFIVVLNIRINSLCFFEFIRHTRQELWKYIFENVFFLHLAAKGFMLL